MRMYEKHSVDCDDDIQTKEIQMNEAKDCGCGRSPTGKCIGWHGLSEEEFQAKLKAFEDKKKSQD